MIGKPPKAHATKATSAAIAGMADKARKFSILSVTGISRGKLSRIEPPDFGKLDVDASYQRGETGLVSQIVTALQRGGAVLDPVTLCRRTSWDGKSQKLWVIDGHQRVCAFQQLGIGFEAMIHESESLEAERVFFLSLNTRHAMSANLMVKSWPGRSGKMLVEANANPSHPLYQRLGMEQSDNKSRLGAMVLVRGTFKASTNLKPNGRATEILSRLDVALNEPEKRARAEHFIRFIGHVCPKGKMHFNVIEAYGAVAFERWGEEIELPSKKIIDRLKIINWQMELPDLDRKYLPVMEGIVKRWWK